MYIFAYVGVESLRNITVTNTTIKVVWNDAVSPNGCGTVFYYIAIAVNLMDRSDMMTMEPRDNVTEFSNLINGTSYEISVFAINRVGNGTSSMINVTTLHDNEGIVLNSTNTCMNGTGQSQCCKHSKLTHSYPLATCTGLQFLVLQVGYQSCSALSL